MKMKWIGACAALCIGSSFVGAQSVQISQDGRPERMARISHAKGLNQMDHSFFNKMAAGNNFEIITSQIAAERASTAWARDFAKEMVQEHKGAQNELQLVADKKGVEAKGNLDTKMMKDVARLKRLRGAAFDNAYRAIQLAAHAQASNLLKKQIASGRDEDVRSYAVKMLPAVVMHWKMAQTRTTMTGTNKMGHGM